MKNVDLLTARIFNVQDFGAIGDGTTDDTQAFEDAIAAASTISSSEPIDRRAGTVFVPPGRFVVSRPLKINDLVNLTGVGARKASPRSSPGSLVCIKHNHDVALTIDSHGVEISNLGFDYIIDWWDKANHEAVNLHPTIYAHGDQIKLRQLFFPVANRAIVAEGGSIQIDGIYGCPMREGILIRESADVGYVNNIHFWDGFAGGPNPEIVAWRQQNTEGIVVERADNWLFSNIFVNHVHVAFHCRSQKVSRFKLCNMDVDGSTVGVLIDSDRTNGMITNLAVSASEFPGATSIHIKSADEVTLYVSNALLMNDGSKFDPTDRYCVRVHGNNSKVYLQNISFDPMSGTKAVSADVGFVQMARAGLEFTNRPYVPSRDDVFFQGHWAVV